MTTYSTIKIDSKYWLAPERIEAFELWKSGWIEIKEEHRGEFEGRTGLEKGVHFEIMVTGCRSKQCLCGYLTADAVGCSFRAIVAIPINTDQGRIVAVPIGEVEDEVWEEAKNLLYSDTCVPPIYVTAVFDYLKRKSFTIKRKQ
jgi:hypothetical protein